MNAHTPTPWRLVYGDDDIDVVGSNGRTVATVNLGPGVAEDERNAALIVRAVNEYEQLKAERDTARDAVAQLKGELARTENERADLLAALEGLFEHCAMIHKDWGDGSNQREADAAISAARAVIAKARGND